jgi:mRNA interferase RelE/StbE
VHRIPRKVLRQILDRIASLRSQPRPPGGEKLSAQEQYRIRQGDYRIIYGISDADLTVVVVKIAHRRDVYRQ